MTNNRLQFDELGALDREITQWGYQGFEDIAAIVHDDHTWNKDDPVLSEDDIINRQVKSMRVQDGDLFVTTNAGEILHYRMTIERL